jgi:hypothetical protein
MAGSVFTLTVTEPGIPPAAMANRLLNTPSAQDTLRAVQNELERIAGGTRGAKYSLVVESSAAAAATGSITCVAASLAAGDKLIWTIPGYKAVVFTVVATDAEVTAAPGTGLYSKETATNTAVGDQLVAAIAAHPLVGKYVVGVNTTGTVALTARKLGTAYATIGLNKELATAAGHVITAFSGGANEGKRATATIVLDQSKLTADDTLRIGATTFTWKASASGESQVTIGASSTAAGDNLVAKINAHSGLAGLMSAVNVTGTVTITWLGAPRTGEQIYMVKSEATPDAMTLTQMASGSVEAYQAAAVTYQMGAAA